MVFPVRDLDCVRKTPNFSLANCRKIEFFSGRLLRTPSYHHGLGHIFGCTTPPTEYVKNTAITPPMKRASLTETRKVFRICENESNVERRSEN